MVVVTLRRIWRLFLLLLVVLTHVPYALVGLLWHRKSHRALFQARRQHVGTRAICRMLGVTVEMKEALPKGEGFTLIVCNHLGLLDPFILASRMHVSFVAKAEVGRWPVLGFVCKVMGLLFVERNRPWEARQFIQQAQEKLEDGIPVLAFPEGTVGAGDTVMPFKTGVFQMVAGLEDGMVIPLYLCIHTVEDDPERWQEVSWAGKTFVQHIWQLLGLKAVTAEIYQGDPILTASQDRRSLALAAHQAVLALARQQGHALSA